MSLLWEKSKPVYAGMSYDKQEMANRGRFIRKELMFLLPEIMPLAQVWRWTVPEASPWDIRP